jgi:hypothetical protein
LQLTRPERIAAPKISLALALCLALLPLSGCSEWKASNTIDTVPAADTAGDGPGLVSGKEGGIVFYNDVWSGAVPGGGTAE